MYLDSAVQRCVQAGEKGLVKDCLAAVDELESQAIEWPHHAAIRILPNLTCNMMVPALQLAGFKRGISTDVEIADYDTYAQETVDRDSPVRTRSYDAIVLALWLSHLPMAFDERGVLQEDVVLEQISGLTETLLQTTTALIALNTFVPPSHAVWRKGSVPGLAELNLGIQQLASENGRLLAVDFFELTACLGTDEALDPRYGFMHKAPLKLSFMHLWANRIMGAIASRKGLARKVVAVDCDNTLWGGVVGEDGLHGIRLDPYEFPGNVFTVFQQQLLQLVSQGVLLVLCSKNSEADVLEVIDNHPACLIRREHLAGWRINWNDKARNLTELAAELNLGLDSFVFIDDSPVECGLVREMLPEVEVLQVPKRVYRLPEMLQTYGAFLRLAVTAEDRGRTAQYHAQRQREQESQRAASLEEYLAGLELVVEIWAAGKEDVSRVAQLTQKTNQFNLTTRRYGEGDIEGFMASEAHLVLCMNVSDKYGKYGLTGVAVLVREEEVARIDTLLMSCRVLGRRVEDVFLAQLAEHARTVWQGVALRAEFIPTRKNAQVADFYEHHGFRAVLSSAEGTSYELTPGCEVSCLPDFVEVRHRS